MSIDHLMALGAAIVSPFLVGLMIQLVLMAIRRRCRSAHERRHTDDTPA
jgi:hypothetical protein